MLITKDALVTVKHLHSDSLECYVILVLEFIGEPITVITILLYAPLFSKSLLELLMTRNLEVAEGPFDLGWG